MQNRKLNALPMVLWTNTDSEDSIPARTVYISYPAACTIMQSRRSYTWASVPWEWEEKCVPHISSVRRSLWILPNTAALAMNIEPAQK